MAEKKLKKAEPVEEEQLYPIQCTQPGAKKGTAQLFQCDGKKFYVEFNKTVYVPEWVYVLWRGSKYNSAKQMSDCINPDHLMIDEQ